MPSEHARLSPSAAERWISCPASVNLIETLGLDTSTDNVFTREGTAAHALAEIEARSLTRSPLRGPALGKARREWAQEYPEANAAEMAPHVTEYKELLRERLSIHPQSMLFLEQRLPTGVPSCWGTSDAVIVSPVHVEIVDFKYGQGVAVEAEGNPQLRLYGVGALDTFGDLLGDVQTVRMTICQPRINSCSTAEMSAADLRAWRDALIPVAEEALGELARFGPSVGACRWCPAKGLCRAQMEWVTAAEFGHDYDVLTPEELAEQLDRLPALKQWMLAVEDTALRLAYSEGVEIPRYKVVLSGSRRFVGDPEAAMESLGSRYAPECFSERRLNGIGALEKFLGSAFEEELGPYINRTPGKPALVAHTDKRRSITSLGQAVEDFSGSYEDQ